MGLEHESSHPFHVKDEESAQNWRALEPRLAGSEAGTTEEWLLGSQARGVGLGSGRTWTLPEEGWRGEMSKHSKDLSRGV